MAHIYCAGLTVQKVWKIETSDMSKIAESANYGAAISALTTLGDYIYCAGNGKVWKISIPDMSKVAEGANSGVYNALATDGVYIYVAGSSGGSSRVWKIDPSDMSVITQSANFVTSINALTILGNYIYCAGHSRIVYKIALSNMSTVDELYTGNTLAQAIRALTNDGSHIYCNIHTPYARNIWKIDPSDMSKIDESAFICNNIYALSFHNEYTYVAGGNEDRVRMIRPSDMVITGYSDDYGSAIRALTSDGSYVYCAGGSNVWKLTTTLTKEAESINYGGYIRALTYSIAETEIINIKATKLAGHLTLYGEITDLADNKITERGFEYKIQDNEPEEEDTGTEVKETNEDGFGEEEYGLYSSDTFDDLYRAEENTIWWFRAYCKDAEDNKYKATSWMKNVPTVTTNGTSTTIFASTCEGNLTDIGANIATKRGMRIVKNFVGSIHETLQYIIKGFTVYSQEHRRIYSKGGVLIGFEWVIVFERYAYTEDGGGYPTGEYEITVGDTLMTGLIPGDNYDIYAFAENNLGKGFGDAINTTMQKLMSEEGEPIISPITAEKTVSINNLPGGCKVIRAGIRYGKTPSCNEGYVEKEGEWYNGETVTFFITGLIPDTKYYENPYTIIEDGEGNQEEVTQPEEEWPEMDTLEDLDFPEIKYPLMDEQGIDYELIVIEIKCSKIADQSIIDMFGRRRSQTLENHLIQDMDTCRTVRDNYLEEFQILKLKVVLDYDIPIPFERADCILLGDGKYNYKDDGEGVIGAKDDGEGIIKGQKSLLAKIRKIDIKEVSGKGTILKLELEV